MELEPLTQTRIRHHVAEHGGDFGQITRSVALLHAMEIGAMTFHSDLFLAATLTLVESGFTPSEIDFAAS